MKNAIILGATGFGGVGLIGILHLHPEIKIKQIIDIKNVNMFIHDVFPHLKGFFEMKVEGPEDIDYSGIDIAFFSTPDRAGMTMINNFFKKGIPVIDFSGDFRFNTIEEYSNYARFKNMEDTHLSPDILKYAVYGLPEINADKIKNAKVIGNPGCYATSIMLGLLPVVEMGLADSDTYICDGKSGVSGAGKNPGEANFFPQRHENINTYREGKHQHIFEVENVLTSKHRNPVRIFFIPQVVPMARGILSNLYAQVKSGYNTKNIMDAYKEYYKGKPFIIITDKSPNTSDVRGTNRCEIRPMVDERTGILFITSVIDNLMKGQAGNAVQNANILLSLDEKTGLDVPAFYP